MEDIVTARMNYARLDDSGSPVRVRLNSTVVQARNVGDPAAAKQFYEGLFGWSIVTGENDTSGYLHIKNGQEFIGGIPSAEQQDPNAPPHWMPYIQVGDVDASTAQAQEMGGAVYMPPMTLENVVGQFAPPATYGVRFTIKWGSAAE